MRTQEMFLKYWKILPIACFLAAAAHASTCRDGVVLSKEGCTGCQTVFNGAKTWDGEVRCEKKQSDPYLKVIENKTYFAGKVSKYSFQKISYNSATKKYEYKKGEGHYFKDSRNGAFIVSVYSPTANLLAFDQVKLIEKYDVSFSNDEIYSLKKFDAKGKLKSEYDDELAEHIYDSNGNEIALYCSRYGVGDYVELSNATAPVKIEFEKGKTTGYTSQKGFFVAVGMAKEKIDCKKTMARFKVFSDKYEKMTEAEDRFAENVRNLQTLTENRTKQEVESDATVKTLKVMNEVYADKLYDLRKQVRTAGQVK